MCPDVVRPPESEVVDRLHRHLHSWLGAWPPTEGLIIVGSAHRAAPCWDGVIRPFAGVSTPTGTVLSVAPDRLEAALAAGSDLEEVLEALPEILGQPGAMVGRGVYRYSVAPAEGDGINAVSPPAQRTPNNVTPAVFIVCPAMPGCAG